MPADVAMPVEDELGTGDLVLLHPADVPVLSVDRGKASHRVKQSPEIVVLLAFDEYRYGPSFRPFQDVLRHAAPAVPAAIGLLEPAQLRVPEGLEAVKAIVLQKFPI